MLLLATAGTAKLGVNSAADALNLNSLALGFKPFFAGAAFASFFDSADSVVVAEDFASVLLSTGLLSPFRSLLLFGSFFAGLAGLALLLDVASGFASLPFTFLGDAVFLGDPPFFSSVLGAGAGV